MVKRPWKDGRRFTYFAVYPLPNGKQKWEKVGSNKKQAERVLAERVEQSYSGTYRELKGATFAEFAAKWLADYAEARLKPSTVDGYRRYIDMQLNPAFGSHPLQSITTGEIQEFVARTLASGRSGKTANNYLVVLRKLLADAVRWGYLANNPAADVQRARVERTEMAALTPEQIRRLLDAAEPEYQLVYRVAVFTGVRCGELLALRWGDVDWRRGQLVVRRSVWKGHVSEPKSRRGIRRIDLGPELLAALRSAQPSSAQAHDLIFHNAEGRFLDARNLTQRHFEPTLKRAEIPRVRFHDLRHTFASLLIAQGVHPKAIQDQLGHASITTTLDRYGHLLPGVHEHGGAALEALVSGDDPASSEEAAA